MNRFAIAAIAVLLAGCASTPAVDAGSVEFAPELGISLERMTRSPRGLYSQDLQVGPGELARSGQTVTVHYTGWVSDGRKFDSSVDRAQPLEMVIGRGNVIRGWDDGIVGMRVGGKRRLVVPPHLAYGSEGAGGGLIPPRATLVFDIELLAVR